MIATQCVWWPQWPGPVPVNIRAGVQKSRFFDLCGPLNRLSFRRKMTKIRTKYSIQTATTYPTSEVVATRPWPRTWSGKAPERPRKTTQSQSSPNPPNLGPGELQAMLFPAKSQKSTELKAWGPPGEVVGGAQMAPPAASWGPRGSGGQGDPQKAWIQKHQKQL